MGLRVPFSWLRSYCLRYDIGGLSTNVLLLVAVG